MQQAKENYLQHVQILPFSFSILDISWCSEESESL